MPSATPAIIQSNPVKNPGHRLRKLRRSRGSICPWFASFSGPIAILGHGISDGALQAAPLGRLDMAPHSAPFGGLCPPAIFLPWLACPGWQRRNLAGEPVGHVQGPTLHLPGGGASLLKHPPASSTTSAFVLIRAD
ncbi:hypothetical protein CPJ18_19780 [Agrobacterium rosae]|uniref:Uncharacterized protein n=1 Tax=Agrobacterium rosae TaxID=1972867 RepID=A0AAE5VNZ0_9HYPH|nr:hypothetical protein CPJ18_19780 [Agrobacterium rosae]